MGDVAEGLINGDFDSYTGEYLGEGDGFPRSTFNNGGGQVWTHPKDKAIEDFREIMRTRASSLVWEEKKLKRGINFLKLEKHTTITVAAIEGSKYYVVDPKTLGKGTPFSKVKGIRRYQFLGEHVFFK